MPAKNSTVPTPREVVTQLAPKPTHSYVHVTPEIAERWLRSNTANRAIRHTKVNQYARDMLAGRWTLSNDDLCFDVDGRLQNGQHRLNAVILSGCTVVMGVKRNLPRTAMHNMDTGAARSASEVLRFDNEKNGALLAATVKQLILIQSRRIYQDTKQQGVSHGEIVQWLSDHDEWLTEAQSVGLRAPEVNSIRHSVSKTTSVKSAVDASPTSIAVAHYLIADANGGSLADLFIERIAEPINEPQGSAVHAIRGRLREVQKNRQVYPTRNHIYLLLKGWNYYADGRAVQRLQMAPKAGTRFKLPDVARWSR